MTKFEQIQEFIKCKTDPVYYAKKYCEVFDLTKGGFKEFDVFPKQIELLKHYRKNRFSIVLKPRQAGVSTVTALEAANLVAFADSKSPQRILIVANKQATAFEFLKKVKSFIEPILGPQGKMPWLGLDKTNNSSGYLELSNGSSVKATATSEDALRGYTPTILIMDEAAFIRGGKELWVAALPALSTGGRAILLSTPYGYDPLYYWIYDGALTGKNDFKIYEMRWYHDPRFNKDLKWIKGDEVVVTFDEAEQRELIKKGFRPMSTWYDGMCRQYNYDSRAIASELDNAFLGSGDNVVQEEYIVQQEKCNVRPPIRTEGFDNNVWIWEDPIENHQYIIAGDVSRGDSADFSTFSIIDCDTGNQVAEYQGKLPPDKLGELMFEWGVKYNALCAVDITGGMGQATVIKLVDMGYPNLYYSDSKSSKVIMQKMKNYSKKNGELVAGFIIGSNRTLVIQEIERTMRMGEFVIRSQRLINELRTFIYKNGRADHMTGFHDDLIFASAIALFIFQHSFKSLKRYNSQTKAMLDAWTVSTNKNNFIPDNFNKNNNDDWLFS